MRLFRTTSSDCSAKWLDNILQFTENESVILSQAVLAIAVWLLCFISVHKHRTLSTIVFGTGELPSPTSDVRLFFHSLMTLIRT